MKRRYRWAAVVIGLAAGVIATGLVAANGPWTRSLLVRSLRDSTGLDIGLDDVRVSLAGPSITLVGLTILNPPGFEAGEALRFKEVHAASTYGALLRGQTRLTRVVLDMPHLIVVRNREGEYNWHRIGQEVQAHAQTSKPTGGPAGSPTYPPPSSRPPPPSSPAKPSPKPKQGPIPSTPEWSIDELTVRIQSIEVRDFRRSSTPTPRRMDIAFEHTATNITDIQAVGTEIGGRLMVRAAPLLLASAIEAAAESDAGKNLSESLQKGVDRLFRKLDPNPSAATNPNPDRAGSAHRALKSLFSPE